MGHISRIMTWRQCLCVYSFLKRKGDRQIMFLKALSQEDAEA